MSDNKMILAPWMQVGRKQLYTRTYKRVECVVTEYRSYDTLILVREQCEDYNVLYVGECFDYTATTRKHFSIALADCCYALGVWYSYRNIKACFRTREGRRIADRCNVRIIAEWRECNHWRDMRLGRAFGDSFAAPSLPYYTS